MGCKIIDKTEEGHIPVTYEIVEEADIPEDMMKEIRRKKVKPFRLVYREPGYVYAGEGYGKQEQRKCCIEWVECAETEDALYIETTLHGPGGNGVVCEDEYPYSVIRIEEKNKQVIFEK